MSGGASNDSSNVLIGHTQRVFCANFNKEGTKLASGSFDGSIHIWDVQTNVCSLVITPEVPVYCLDWDDDKNIVCGLGDESIRIYDSENGEEKLVIEGDDGQVTCVEWNGNKIASTAHSQSLKVWNSENGEREKIFSYTNSNSQVNYLNWHPDGKTIAAGTDDSKIIICDLVSEKSELKFEFNGRTLSSLAYNTSGKKLACGFFQGFISILNTESTGNYEEIVLPLRAGVPVFALAWSSDGNKLASTGINSVSLWDTENLTKYKVTDKLSDDYLKKGITSTYNLSSSMDIIKKESIHFPLYLDWKLNKLAVVLSRDKDIYILDAEDLSIEFIKEKSVEEEENENKETNMDNIIDLTEGDLTKEDLTEEDEAEPSLPLPLALKPERIRETDKVSNIRQYQRSELLSSNINKEHVYVFACVNIDPEALMPNMNIYAYCTYALYFLSGEHRMIIYDTSANLDNIRDAVQNFYGLKDEALRKFYDWLTNHVSFGLYIQNLDKLKEAVRVNANQCLSFLYLSAHSPPNGNGRIALPEKVLTEVELEDFSLSIGEIRLTFQKQHCLSKDFQCMLNGCFLGQSTASVLSKNLENHLILGTTQCIPTGGVTHSFKVADNRLDFSAKVILEGQNRLYAYYNEVASVVMRCAYVFIEDAATILEREFATNKHIQCVESNSVKTIGKLACFGCKNLKSVVMPNVETVGETAFWFCQELFDVRMPKVKTIKRESFRSCGEMSIFMLEVEIVENGAFCRSQIKDATMPKLTELGESAFEECKELTRISIKEITKLKEKTFLNCKKLMDVYAPALRSYPETAFQGCTVFKGIRRYRKRKKTWVSRGSRRRDKKRKPNLVETFCKLRF
jgi:WD40 repeat protein